VSKIITATPADKKKQYLYEGCCHENILTNFSGKERGNILIAQV